MVGQQTVKYEDVCLTNCITHTTNFIYAMHFQITGIVRMLGLVCAWLAWFGT